MMSRINRMVPFFAVCNWIGWCWLGIGYPERGAVALTRSGFSIAGRLISISWIGRFHEIISREARRVRALFSITKGNWCWLGVRTLCYYDKPTIQRQLERSKRQTQTKIRSVSRWRSRICRGKGGRVAWTSSTKTWQIERRSPKRDREPVDLNVRLTWRRQQNGCEWNASDRVVLFEPARNHFRDGENLKEATK